MNSSFRLIICLQVLPAILFSQTERDTATGINLKEIHEARRYPEDSTFSILVNFSTVFYTAKDPRIDNFLLKYGYKAPEPVPVGVNVELAAVPFNSKMMYSLSASTIVSNQDIISSEFKLGFYRRFFERQHFWISGGLGLGTHGSRVILDGNMPPHFDSLAAQYNRELALRRKGFVIEPAIRFFWYPLQTKRFQLGLFVNTAYDFSFNTKWELGYYSDRGQFATFKGITKNSDVQTHKEFGWAFSDGLSFCFKFD